MKLANSIILAIVSFALLLCLQGCGGRVTYASLLRTGSSIACTVCALTTKRTAPVCTETTHEEASQRPSAQPLEAQVEEAREGEAAHPRAEEASDEAQAEVSAR